MAKTKKKEVGEMTPDELLDHKLGLVAGHATLSDKISWNRKYDNMQKLVAQVNPIESQIIELNAALIPLYDEINELRQIMVSECIHPVDQLVTTNDFIVCKFCDTKFAIKSM